MITWKLMFSGGSNLCCGGNENLCKFAKTFRNLSRRETQLYHIKEKMAKAMKGLGVLKRLSRMPPQRSLLTIYKLFIQPHLDYVDVLYDQPNIKRLCQKTETIQYNIAQAITCAIINQQLNL